MRHLRHSLCEAATRFARRDASRTFDDTKVAVRAATKCLKRPLISLALVGRESTIITVEFDNNRPLLQPGLVGLNLTGGSGQKAAVE